MQWFPHLAGEPTINLLVRGFLAVVFLAAGLQKVRRRQAFADVVRGYGLLPLQAAELTAYVLPWIELGVALAFLAPVPVGWPSWAGISLLTGFTCAMTINLLRGNTTATCGCFEMGHHGGLNWTFVLRNVALMQLCASLVMAPAWVNAYIVATLLALVILSLPWGALLTTFQRRGGENPSTSVITDLRSVSR